MKSVMKSMMMLLSFMMFSTSAFASFSSGGGSSSQAPSNGNYYCKSWGDRVCAVNKSTGQCTHEWSRRDGGDPMFFCKKHIGLDVGRVKKENLFCRDMGGYVCAASKIHNQCTQSWRKEQGGGDAMFFCKKYLGQAGSSWNPANYVCKNTGNGACAQSIRTGQCTHSWNRRDSHDPMGDCYRFLRR